MAVVRVALLEPIERIYRVGIRAALVVGGGIAGMNAARNLPIRAFSHFVEKSELSWEETHSPSRQTWKGENVQQIMCPTSANVASHHPKIEVLTGLRSKTWRLCRTIHHHREPCTATTATCIMEWLSLQPVQRALEPHEYLLR